MSPKTILSAKVPSFALKHIPINTSSKKKTDEYGMGTMEDPRCPKRLVM